MTDIINLRDALHKPGAAPAIRPALMQRDVAPSTSANDDAPLVTAERPPEASNVVLSETSRDPNVGEMQGLDSTIGDYSQPDPLPTEMLRRSYEAATLGLVDQQDQLASAEGALDSTVGDYSQPDPLPNEMLRRSYQAAILGLVNPQGQLVSAVRLSQTSGRIAGGME